MQKSQLDFINDPDAGKRRKNRKKLKSTFSKHELLEKLDENYENKLQKNREEEENLMKVQKNLKSKQNLLSRSWLNNVQHRVTKKD